MTYDKAKVECGVLVVERWIVAALRNRRFFGIEELNQAIRELLVKLNQRPFRKREGTRASLFESLDKPALAALPSERFDLSEWSKARVNIDYHVVFDGNYYSVPYQLVQEQVEVRSMPATVEIFHKGKRVASHLRSRGNGQAVTNAEHRPRSHQEHLSWTPSRIVNWARTIGPSTARLVERLMQDKPHPEMGYRACLGVIRLEKKYSRERLEAAALRALLTGACRYRSVESMLKNSLDRQPLEAAPDLGPPPRHDNIRGAEYFDRGEPAC
jgi:transposase